MWLFILESHTSSDNLRFTAEKCCEQLNMGHRAFCVEFSPSLGSQACLNKGIMIYTDMFKVLTQWQYKTKNKADCLCSKQFGLHLSPRNSRNDSKWAWKSCKNDKLSVHTVCEPCVCVLQKEHPEAQPAHISFELKDQWIWIGMPMQFSACTGSIKIDCTQLMQVEMPIFLGWPDRNGINGTAADSDLLFSGSCVLITCP